MTEEQEKQLNTLIAQGQENHDFWHKPFIMGQPTRAVQLDRVLSLSRGSVFTGKLLMMLFGAVITVVSVKTAISSIVKFMGSEG